MKLDDYLEEFEGQRDFSPPPCVPPVYPGSQQKQRSLLDLPEMLSNAISWFIWLLLRFFIMLLLAGWGYALLTGAY